MTLKHHVTSTEPACHGYLCHNVYFSFRPAPVLTNYIEDTRFVPTGFNWCRFSYHSHRGTTVSPGDDLAGILGPSNVLRVSHEWRTNYTLAKLVHCFGRLYCRVLATAHTYQPILRDPRTNCRGLRNRTTGDTRSSGVRKFYLVTTKALGYYLHNDRVLVIPPNRPTYQIPRHGMIIANPRWYRNAIPTKDCTLRPRCRF